MNEEATRQAVRESYGKIAEEGGSCCASNGCCGGRDAAQVSRNVGYDDADLAAVPDGANLGLGCGNPVALAGLHEGEEVLDLGSGAGFDCFLAAAQVGAEGRVVGVDMTAEMVSRARENAAKSDYDNVEFRLGEIEHLPVERDSVDAVISNCVINLVPDKDRAFAEAFRVLRPGGRLMVSDIVLERELPDFIRDSAAAYVACISGAELKGNYLQALQGAGFEQVEVVDETAFTLDMLAEDPAVRAGVDEVGMSMEVLQDAVNIVSSIKVQAVKPG